MNATPERMTDASILKRWNIDRDSKEDSASGFVSPDWNTLRAMTDPTISAMAIPEYPFSKLLAASHGEIGGPSSLFPETEQHQFDAHLGRSRPCPTLATP